jgi:hypothetical protein
MIADWTDLDSLNPEGEAPDDYDDLPGIAAISPRVTGWNDRDRQLFDGRWTWPGLRMRRSGCGCR